MGVLKIIFLVSCFFIFFATSPHRSPRFRPEAFTFFLEIGLFRRKRGVEKTQIPPYITHWHLLMTSRRFEVTFTLDHFLSCSPALVCHSYSQSARRLNPPSWCLLVTRTSPSRKCYSTSPKEFSKNKSEGRIEIPRLLSKEISHPLSSATMKTWVSAVPTFGRLKKKEK